VGISLAVLLVLGMSFWSVQNGGRASDSAPEGIEAFLDQHWDFPLAPQGAPPHDLSFRESSLDVESCAQCHASQYADWKNSRHSQTMNAGIRWQFHVFSQAESNKCMDCHAPLAEQKALVARDRGWANAPPGEPPAYIPGNLHHQGLTCAACHVREHKRFGPEHRLGLKGDEDGLPHGGFHPRAAFSDSRFCASCHQFPDDGPRLNGKLRQDTYNEWLRSDFGRRGVSCQECHMPDRRHLWRGITDRDMVRRAMSIELVGRDEAQSEMAIDLEIANVGAGHHFPAYMVPRIDVRLLLLDPEGNVAAEVLHHVIQWRTSVDLTRESFDTRLPAGEAVKLSANLERPEETGWTLALRVDVAPKEHYERMYQDMMRQADRMDAMTLNLLRIAIAEAGKSRYRAIDELIPLEGPVHLSLQYEPLPASAADE